MGFPESGNRKTSDVSSALQGHILSHYETAPALFPELVTHSFPGAPQLALTQQRPAMLGVGQHWQPPPTTSSKRHQREAEVKE